MKKIITLLAGAFLILSVTSLWAGNEMNQSLLILKKKNDRHILPNLKLADGGGEAFTQGKMVLSLGYGAMSGGFLKAILKAYQDSAGYNFSSFGPVHFRGEYAMSDKVGLVLSINNNSWKASWTHRDSGNATIIYHDEMKRTVTSVLARLNFHFGVTQKLDPYWGIGAGYRIANYSFTSTDVNYHVSIKSPFHLGFETTLGVRYYIMPGFGLYGELGLAQSVIQGGLVVAF